MRWTGVVTVGAAVAVLLTLVGCGASGPPLRPDYGDDSSGGGGAQTGDSPFPQDFAKITANSACENLPLEEIAEYLEYQSWGSKGQLNSEYTPGQPVMSYGKCQALNVVLPTGDADLGVGVIPARTQEELDEDWAMRIELAEKNQDHSGVEGTKNSPVAGPWDQGQLFRTDQGVWDTIQALVRGRSFVIEVHIKVSKGEGAAAQHVPHTPDGIATWLEQTYLPQAYTKVMTIVGES